MFQKGTVFAAVEKLRKFATCAGIIVQKRNILERELTVRPKIISIKNETWSKPTTYNELMRMEGYFVNNIWCLRSSYSAILHIGCRIHMKMGYISSPNLKWKDITHFYFCRDQNTISCVIHELTIADGS